MPNFARLNKELLRIEETTLMVFLLLELEASVVVGFVLLLAFTLRLLVFADFVVVAVAEGSVFCVFHRAAPSETASRERCHETAGNLHAFSSMALM